MKRWTPTFCQTRVILSGAEEKGESENDEELETDGRIDLDRIINHKNWVAFHYAKRTGQR